MSDTRDYSTAITNAEEYLAEVRSRVPEEFVVRDEMIVTDLDRDAHRLTCSETTSLYSNAVSVWLTTGSDSVALVEELKRGLVAEGWLRSESIEEQMNGEQALDGPYQQLLANQDGFHITLSRWSAPGVGEGLQINVRSPCVANPIDKPDYWGK